MTVSEMTVSEMTVSEMTVILKGYSFYSLIH